MGVKFTCDWCGEEIKNPFYDCYEGWQVPTMEWWEEGKAQREGYHISVFCGNKYDHEAGQWSDDSCQIQFMRTKRILCIKNDKSSGWRYIQKKELEERDLVYDKRGFYTQAGYRHQRVRFRKDGVPILLGN